MYNLRRWKIVVSNYQTPVCVNANLLPNLYVLAVCLHCFSIQLALDAGPPRFWQLCSLIDSIPVWHVKNPKLLESHFMCDSSCAPHYEGDASKPTDTNRPAANSQVSDPSHCHTMMTKQLGAVLVAQGEPTRGWQCHALSPHSKKTIGSNISRGLSVWSMCVLTVPCVDFLQILQPPPTV